VKKLNVQTAYNLFDSKDDLPADIQELLVLAQDAITRAYAPYSHFQVGAAVLLDNGKTVTGNNQENAAYPSGMCAERVAIWSASSQYPNVAVKKIVITVKSTLKQVDKPVAPCGACRQTLLEYEHKQQEPIEVYFMGETGKVVQAHSLKDLLPFAFDESFL